MTPVHGCWHQIAVAKQLGAMAFKGAKPSAVVMDCLPNMQQDAPGQVRPLPSGKLFCRSPLAPYYPMPLCRQGYVKQKCGGAARLSNWVCRQHTLLTPGRERDGGCARGPGGRVPLGPHPHRRGARVRPALSRAGMHTGLLTSAPFPHVCRTNIALTRHRCVIIGALQGTPTTGSSTPRPGTRPASQPPRHVQPCHFIKRRRG